MITNYDLFRSDTNAIHVFFLQASHDSLLGHTPSSIFPLLDQAATFLTQCASFDPSMKTSTFSL